MAAEPPRKYGRGSTRASPRASITPLGSSMVGADDPLAAFPSFASSPQEQMQFQFQQQLELQQQQFAISTGTGGSGSSVASATSAGMGVLGAAQTFVPLDSNALMDTSASMLERAQAAAQAVSAASTPPTGLGPYYKGLREQRNALSMAPQRSIHTSTAGNSASSSLLTMTGSLPSVTASSPPPPPPQLYKTSKMRRPELWQFIRLVVPDPPEIAAGKTYTNQDAREAYCLKCKLLMHYNTGSSNNVSRHMAKFHPLDLANYAQKVADKKKKLRTLHGRLGGGHVSSNSSSSHTSRNVTGTISNRIGSSAGKRKLRAVTGGSAPYTSNTTAAPVSRRGFGANPLAVRVSGGKTHAGYPGDSMLGMNAMSEDELSDDLHLPKSKKKPRRAASVESADGHDGESGTHAFHDDSEFFLDYEEEDEEEELDQHETETLNALIARWVCKHYHPLGITENRELQDIIGYALSLRKRIALPSQNVVRASVESLTAKTRLDMLRQFSNEMMFFAMATEVWTTADNEAFLSISIHYNTDKFERRHFTLDVREYNGPLTADAKRELLDALLSRWNLDSRYLCSMMWQPYPTSGFPSHYGNSNSGSNINRNYEIGMVHTQQTEGVAHAFQLILAPLLHNRRALAADNMRNFFHDNMVNQTIDCMPLECQRGAAFVRTQVEFFRELAQFFTSHPRAVARLSKFIAGTTSPHHHAHRLVTDVKGNWVSTLDMLKRLLRKKRAIHEFYAYLDTHEGSLEFQNCGNFPRRAPTRAQWCALECILQLLQPFESVAGAIGKEKYATLALSLPLLQFLKRDLEKKNDFERVFTAYNLPVSGVNAAVAISGTVNSDNMPVGSSDGAAAHAGDDGDNDENAVAATIRASLETVRAYLYMQFVVHFARPCNGLMWLSQLDPRFVRMRFLNDEERLASKTRLGERCFLISHFLQSMANQQNRGSGSSGGSGSSSAGGVAMGGNGLGSGLDGGGYPGDGGGDSVFDSAAFLDETANKEDHDTSSFLRELLFDDAPDEVAPQPPQAPQQPHVDHRHLDGSGSNATANRSHQYGGSNGAVGALGDGLLHPEPTDSNATSAVAAAATVAAAFATRSSAMDVSLVPSLSSSRVVEDEQDAALRNRVTDEVNVYYEDVSAASAPAVRDPMRWWKENGARYPLLGPLARKWLSAIGSVRPTTDALRILAPTGRPGAHNGGSSTAGGIHTSGGGSGGAGGHVGGGSGGAAATPSPILAVPPRSEPDLIRDMVFVHDNC